MLSDNIFGSPNANTMQNYPRTLDDLSDLILIPYDQQMSEMDQKMNPSLYYPPNDAYNSVNIQDLQLQLYQELRNQVMWQDLREDVSFDSSALEHDSASADSSSNTPTYNRLVLSIPEPGPLSSVSSSFDDALKTPHPAYVYTTKASNPKKHKRKHKMPRSKNGCWICRIKHLKCDEIRPHCENCRRFGIECDFSGDRPAYVVNNELRKEKLNSITKKRRVKGEL